MRIAVRCDVFLGLASCLALSLASLAADGAESPSYQPGPLLARFLDGPMKGVDEIIFAVDADRGVSLSQAKRFISIAKRWSRRA